MAHHEPGAEEWTEAAKRRALLDPSRKSARGPYRYAYTEDDFERKLRRERHLPLEEEALASAPLNANALIGEQTEELMAQWGFCARQQTVCRMRMEGHTAAEIALALGISERRVYGIFQELRRLMAIHEGHLPEEEPGDSPHFGWQEVYLDSVRRGR